MKYPMQRQKQQKLLYIGFVVVLLLVITVLAVMLLVKDQKQRESEQALERLRENYVQEGSDATKGTPTVVDDTTEDLMKNMDIEIPKRTINWKALRKENKDIYAWLYIPGTNVDYPVLQHPKENNYYVDHNVDGFEGYPGCISSQQEYNSKDFLDANTILYGHNMRKDGSMFNTLHRFADEAFFEKTKYAYIYMPEATYVYEIFAAYTYTDMLIPAGYDFSSYHGFKDYLSDIFSIRDINAHFRRELNVTAINHIVTFSTCVMDSNDNYRWLVQAVMVNDPTLSAEEIGETFQEPFENMHE